MAEIFHWFGAQELSPFVMRPNDKHGVACQASVSRRFWPLCRVHFAAPRLARDVHQETRDYTQSLMQTEVYSVPKAQRKTIETLFGEDKQIHSMIRLR
jgi:hypothetical protein